MTAKRMIVAALALISAFTGAAIISTTQAPMGDYGNSIASKEWQAYRQSDRWGKSLVRLGITDAEFQQKWANHFESLRRQERDRRLSIMFGILLTVGVLYLVAVSVK